MPLTVLAWNIEELGTRYGRTASSVALETLRCRWVASVARQAGADVIVVQELRRQGVAYLGILLGELNAAAAAAHTPLWHYDWLPGSVVAAPVGFQNLGFNPAGNNEGYAVFWRDGALAPITAPDPGAGLSSGQDTAARVNATPAGVQNFITLVTRGYPLAFNPNSPEITFNAAGVVGDLGFPLSVCPSVNQQISTRRQQHNTNITIPRALRVRRPCRVRLQVPGNLVCDLVVYHAPVGQKNSRSSYYGALIGLASSPANGTDIAAYAGDFNVIDGRQQATLLSYTRTLGYSPAGNTYLPDPTDPTRLVPTKSMVHYAGNPLRAGAAVYGSARDLGFARQVPGGAPTAEVRDVLNRDLLSRDAQRNPLSRPSVLQQELVAAQALLAPGSGVDLAVRAKYGNGVGNVVRAYLNGAYGNGMPPTNPPTGFPTGTDEMTAAAVMYRVFISDHLPVALTYV